jgi:hypothetical protein
MQSCSDNKMTTIFLLFALGFLIYYLSCSDSNKSITENFESLFFKNNVPSNLVKYGKDEPQMFTDNKITDYPVDYNMGYTEHENNAQPIQPPPTQPVDVKIPPQQEFQHAGTILNPPVAEVHNYDGFEENSANMANINEGFDKLVDKPNSADVVKLNNNEMKNFNNKDFLPKEVIPGAFDDFSQAKYNIDDANLINTERYIIGVNTVGQSLKNASYDIRGTIANPKFSISPWNNSTYEPDYNLKPLC